MPTFLFLGLLLLAFSPFIFAVRIVVDDANSSWSYSSPWNAISPSNPCPSCLVQLDSTKALNGTWHDTAYLNTAQLSFTGVSVEIYTICPPPLRSGDAYGTNFSFTLDSIADGNFVGPQPACEELTYNYLVYARRNLSLAQHIVVITNNKIFDRPNTSLLLLDYAIYDDGHVSGLANNKSKFPAIPFPAVIAIAVVAGLSLLVSAALCCRIFSRRSSSFPYGLRDSPIRPSSVVDQSSTQLVSTVPQTGITFPTAQVVNAAPSTSANASPFYDNPAVYTQARMSVSQPTDKAPGNYRGLAEI